MTAQVTRRRFTVDEYYRMAEAGILCEDDHVELIEGEIVEVAPIGSRHAACVDSLNQAFSERVGAWAIVRVQNPVRLSTRTEPEPDIVLARPRPDRYRQAHPGPADVLLLVEVADTTLHYDRDVKLPLYAAAGIPEVWIFNLVHERLEVYREPAEGRFQVQAVCGHGAVVGSQALPGVAIEVTAILG